MSRIQNTFKNLGTQGKKALIPYLMAGFPSLESTLGLMQGLVNGGADIIELGIPFSDPLADGPTIQASFLRSLNKGTTVAKILDLPI